MNVTAPARHFYFVMSITVFFATTTIAQIGIGTTDPQETLHIVGTLRVENTSPLTASNKLTGLDSNGTLREISLNGDLSITNNVLSIDGTTDDFIIKEITINNSSGDINNLNLKLRNNQANRFADMILITPTNNNDVKITGIKNSGIDGQHVYLFFKLNSDKRLELKEETGSSSSNRFLRIYGSGHEHDKMEVKGYGVVELVYSTSFNRWIILSTRR